jgi:2-amino-4-hydroxy-6-hydroxymethyldihydropteridine diphosphokinase
MTDIAAGPARSANAFHSACIALGSNLGGRKARLREALNALSSHAQIRVEAVSSFYETAPVGGPAGQPMYLNAAARLQTSLKPHELLDVMLQIELALGRDRAPGERNGPRTIDLDLLLYEDLALDEPGLTLPHPRMHERVFVLQPLAEVAPHAPHQRLKKTVRELLDELRGVENAVLQTAATTPAVCSGRQSIRDKSLKRRRGP